MEDNSQMEESEDKASLKEKLGEIERQLMTLQWDKDRDQLNPGVEAKYSRLKTEKEELLRKLKEN